MRRSREAPVNDRRVAIGSGPRHGAGESNVSVSTHFRSLPRPSVAPEIGAALSAVLRQLGSLGYLRNLRNLRMIPSVDRTGGFGTFEMLRIALTGGIATGKSHVAARLREAGVPVVDADVIARESWRSARRGWRPLSAGSAATCWLPTALWTVAAWAASCSPTSRRGTISRRSSTRRCGVPSSVFHAAAAIHALCRRRHSAPV